MNKSHSQSKTKQAQSEMRWLPAAGMDLHKEELLELIKTIATPYQTVFPESAEYIFERIKKRASSRALPISREHLLNYVRRSANNYFRDLYRKELPKMRYAAIVSALDQNNESLLQAFGVQQGYNESGLHKLKRESRQAAACDAVAYIEKRLTGREKEIFKVLKASVIAGEKPVTQSSLASPHDISQPTVNRMFAKFAKLAREWAKMLPRGKKSGWR